MRLTLEEQRILRDLADSVTTPTRRGPKPADFEQRQAERRAMREKVGDLINRYEAYLAQQE